MLVGVDVSHHNGDIIWEEAATQVVFAFVKATQGAEFQDPKALDNMRQADRNLVACGPYHYVTADDPNRQADNLLTALDRLWPYRTLPVALDWEEANVPWETVATIISRVIAATATTPIVYTSPRMVQEIPTYPPRFIWAALWKPVMPTVPFPHQLVAWQVGKRRLAGFPGPVDVDVTWFPYPRGIWAEVGMDVARFVSYLAARPGGHASFLGHARVIAQALNVRDRPDLSGRVVGKLAAGDTVGVYGVHGVWCRITPLNDEGRWASGVYLAWLEEDTPQEEDT